MMQRYPNLISRAHFSQRTREMGHPRLSLMSEKWATTRQRTTGAGKARRPFATFPLDTYWLRAQNPVIVCFVGR